MPKLNQIIAAEKGSRSRYEETKTKIYQSLQKDALLSGISRVYQPLDEENGEQLPPESTKVQITARSSMDRVTAVMAELLDTVATKDVGNAYARADIVVDGNTIAVDLPVTFLLFLEKQLVDLRTILTNLPVLDGSVDWEPSQEGDGIWETSARSMRNKKVLRNHVKYEATPEHPAQVETYTEDVPVGTWNTKRFSGAVPARERDDMIRRCEELLKAVKFAREEANSYEVTQQRVGQGFVDYVLTGRR